MKIFGTLVSPYTRRIRLLLNNVEHEFVDLDIFSTAGREVLNNNNPANKVPLLKDGECTVLDSRVIFNYLSDKLSLKPLTWQQQNLLTVIDAANDSLVVLMYGRRSGLPVNEDFMYFNLQHERIKSVFASLNNDVSKGIFDEWQYPSICLFCLIDWVMFRDVIDLSQYQHLLSFHHKMQQMPGIAETDPR